MDSPNPTERLFHHWSLEDVQAAVKAGADINVQHKNTTPLVNALENFEPPEAIAVVKYLINKGANVQAVRIILEDGRIEIHSPLVLSLNMLCLKETKDSPSPEDIAYEIMEMLLEHGANPNEAEVSEEDTNLYTPLTRALFIGEEKFIRLLIKHGADVNMEDNSGRLPLAMALKLENIDLIKLFLNEGAEFSVQKVFPDAIKLENLDILKLLIERGANLNLKSLSGETPLTRALKIRNPQIVQLLIKCGADVNLPDASGDAPLTQAIKLLIRDDQIKRLDVRVLFIVKYLIGGGADLNVVGSDGRSPLTAAVEENHFDLIRLLLDGGADVNRRDGNQKSPISIAVAVKNLRLAKYLQKRGAKLVECLHFLKIEELVKEDEDWAHHFGDLF